MAQPLTANALLSALRGEGLDVEEYPGWAAYGRDEETGKAFGPVKGVMMHHTAGADSAAGLSLVRNGRADLPGPLAHVYIGKSGVVHLLSDGRANHAGTVAQNAYDAVVAESSVHPYPDLAEPIDGNDAFYGAEVANLGNGTDVYPWVQYVAAVRWATAICRFHGWSENSVIGHKEATRRKIDPKGPVAQPDGPPIEMFSMASFRYDVRDALALPAGVWPNQEETVALTTAEIQAVADAVWAKSITNRFRLDATGLPRSIPASIYLEYGDGHYDDLVSRVNLLGTGLNAIEASVNALAVGGVDLDALAVKVADEIYRRMQS